jgi:hypothetical protein
MKQLKKENVAKEYRIYVSQPAATSYYGSFIIKAINSKAALEKAEAMSNAEFNDAVDNWELSDEADTHGETNIDDIVEEGEQF